MVVFKGYVYWSFFKYNSWFDLNWASILLKKKNEKKNAVEYNDSHLVNFFTNLEQNSWNIEYIHCMPCKIVIQLCDTSLLHFTVHGHYWYVDIFYCMDCSRKQKE
jgi:hypothetical protein